MGNARSAQMVTSNRIVDHSGYQVFGALKMHKPDGQPLPLDLVPHIRGSLPIVGFWDHSKAKNTGYMSLKRLVFRGKSRQLLTRRAKQNSVVRCGRDDDVVDGPIQEPQYTSYIDPNTGEPSPTFGARTPLPDMAFWGEDMVRIIRSGQASNPGNDGKKSKIELSPSTRSSSYISNRRKSNASQESRASREGLSGIEGDEGDTSAEEIGEIQSRGSEKPWYTDNDPENDPIEAAYEDMEGKGDGEGDDKEDEEEEDEEDEEEDDEEDEEGEADEMRGGPSALVRKEETDIAPVPDSPLANDELWWNWRKPLPEKEPWSAWHKRTGDSDTVMAAAMAETGQIKLFGEKPTIAEATLARARKRVFYNERMQEEQERRKEVGAMAYYQEWVKAWGKDTSKEAVEEHAEKTGEGVVDQLLDMLQHQTRGEYRCMQGTDIRIRRDPLTMRMREEQIKQVWGGDPVYPTINYVQDPDCVADYRNANFHEPTPDIVESLRESGRLITQEEIQMQQALEKAQELEIGAFDDGMTGAVDIGDKDEDEDDDEEEEIEEEEEAWKVDITSGKQLPTPEAEAAEKTPLVTDLNDIAVSDLTILDESEEVEESGPVEEQEE